MSTKKTIQINQDFLNNNGGGGGSGNNRTLKNRERKEKPKIVIKPNNLKKQLLQKIKNYQNKDEIMQTNATLPITFDTPLNAKESIDNIDADSDFGGEFNKSLNFLQNLSIQKNANKNNSMNKWCYVDDLIEMNPPNEAAIKNLCIECGVDMGESNPRQFCGKTYCKN